MSTPRITVAMPVRNGVGFLESAVESVLTRQKRAGEIALVIVDGDSTDGSGEAAFKLQSRTPRQISVVRREPRGVFDAVNHVWNTAESEFLGWLNADDLYLPGAVDRALEGFKDPEIMWCHGRCEIIDGRERPIRRYISLYKHFLSRGGSFRSLLVENYISQPTVIVRREFWEKVGVLSNRYRFAADYDLWVRLCSISKPLYIPQRQACYRVHPDTLSSRNFHDQFREQLDIAGMHGGGRHPLAIALHRLHRVRTTMIYSILNGHRWAETEHAGRGR